MILKNIYSHSPTPIATSTTSSSLSWLDSGASNFLLSFNRVYKVDRSSHLNTAKKESATYHSLLPTYQFEIYRDTTLRRSRENFDCVFERWWHAFSLIFPISLSSLISHLSSLISHLSSLISHLSSLISYLSSLISHLSSIISHLSHIIIPRLYHLFLAFLILSFILMHWILIICHYPTILLLKFG